MPNRRSYNQPLATYFFAMRHGEKDRDGMQAQLTDRGRRQIDLAVRTHAPLEVFNGIFHSGVRRTIEAAEKAERTLADMEGRCEIERRFFPLVRRGTCDPFGFLWAEEIGLKSSNFVPIEMEIEKKHGKGATVAEWLAAYPPFIGSRCSMTEWMKGQALVNKWKSRGMQETSRRVLILTHGPLGAMAAPLETPAHLDFADTVVYTVIADSNTDVARITSIEFLRCPYIE